MIGIGKNHTAHIEAINNIANSNNNSTLSNYAVTNALGFNKICLWDFPNIYSYWRAFKVR